MNERPEYTIVIPVYYNADTLRLVFEDIKQNVFDVCPQYAGEVLFVDDGSGDNSFDVLKQLKAEYGALIRIIKLSRNFGQGQAIICGMAHTTRATVVMSADGQEPVATISQMLKVHFEEGNEVVIAKREARDETLWRRATSHIVYWLLRHLGNPEMPTGGFDFYLLGPRARDEFVRHWQPNTFSQVRILNLGFKRAWLGYHRRDRKAGKSRWTFSKKLTATLNGVLGHSYIPIRAISVFGLLCACGSFLLTVFFLTNYFLSPEPPTFPGWTPIVLLILFLGGIQMTMIGILGEYLWRVLAQVRQDPPYIVDEKLD